MKRKEWFDATNPTEYNTQKTLEKLHPKWDVYKIAWPDFVVTTPSRFFFLEIKTKYNKHSKHTTSERQQESFNLLKDLGISVQIKYVKQQVDQKEMVITKQKRVIIKRKLRSGFLTPTKRI